MRAMRATISSICSAPISAGTGGVVSGRANGAALQAHLRARFVEHVDGAVRQPVVAQVPGRELRRRLEPVIGIADAMMCFVPRARSPLENLHRLGDRRLVDCDLLEAPRERAVLLDVLEVLVRGRADDAQLACRQDRLDQRREIHRPAGRGPGADRGVDLVDEEDRHRALAERVDDRLEALFEIAAEPGAREERAGVERKTFGPFEQIGHVLAEQACGEAFGERGLADPRVADEDRIVLPSAAENLERALQLRGASDQRIELAGAGAIGQVQGVGRERIARRRRPAFARAGCLRFVRPASATDAAPATAPC